MSALGPIGEYLDLDPVLNVRGSGRNGIHVGEYGAIAKVRLKEGSESGGEHRVRARVADEDVARNQHLLRLMRFRQTLPPRSRLAEGSLVPP